MEINQASAWRLRAAELAAWARRLLVNRPDCFGAYTPVELRGQPGRGGEPITASYTSKRTLNLVVLGRHFRGLHHHHVIGLHSTGVDNTCRWGAFDIDRHAEGTDPEQNLQHALRLHDSCRTRGFRPLLTDSNGAGGFHLRAIFREPVPCRDLHHLLGCIARQNDFRGEFFPKQPAVKPGRFGNWLRLPGLHHTREHWPKVYDGSGWLSGERAIGHILAVEGDDPALVPAAPPPRPPTFVVRPTWRRNRRKGGSASRIAAYIARCPNLGDGQGRDDVAYRIAGFLVRDCNLSDAEAIVWLSAWDEGNQPPKGEKRLWEIMGNAHTYGRNAYGLCTEGGRR